MKGWIVLHDGYDRDWWVQVHNIAAMTGHKDGGSYVCLVGDDESFITRESLAQIITLIEKAGK